MTTQPITLDVQERTIFGKKLGALRRSGITPLHIYGGGAPSLSLQVETSTLIQTLAQVGRTRPLTIRAGGDEHFVMVREVQFHPVTDRLLHVDLIQISQTQLVQATVPIVFEGEAPGARSSDAMLVQDLHEVQVEALPLDLPTSFRVDISILANVDSSIHVRDLELPSKVTLVTDAEQRIAAVVPTRTADTSEKTNEEEDV
jgi:large subunit ribosomal protein L25